MDKELEEAIERLQKNKKQSLYNGECALVDIKDLDIVLEALENSIPKEKVKAEIKRIEDYFDRLNGPDEDIDFIREVKQELLEVNCGRQNQNTLRETIK